MSMISSKQGRPSSSQMVNEARFGRLFLFRFIKFGDVKRNTGKSEPSV